MMKNLQSGKTAKTAEAAPAEKKEERKVIIDHFDFRGGELSYRAAITLHKAVTIPLPPIEASDIGKSSNGTSTAEALNRIFMEIASGVGKAVISVTDSLGSGVKAGGDVLKSGVKGVKDALKGLF